MFALIAAALLSQFQPAEIKPVSLEEYTKRCEETKPGHVNEAKKLYNLLGMKASYISDPKQRKASQDGVTSKLSELSSFSSNPSRVPDLQLDMASATSGDLGLLAIKPPVPQGDDVKRIDKAIADLGLKEPATITVEEAIDDTLILCTDGTTRFVVRIPEKTTSTFTKGKTLKPGVIYQVVGDYTQTTDGKSTSFKVIQEWEHSKERIRKREAAEKSKPPKAAKPKK